MPSELTILTTFLCIRTTGKRQPQAGRQQGRERTHPGHWCRSCSVGGVFDRFANLSCGLLPAFALHADVMAMASAWPRETRSFSTQSYHQTPSLFKWHLCKAAGRGMLRGWQVEGKGVGPMRVWPGGLAMGRTIGDHAGGAVVLCEPEIRQVPTSSPPPVPFQALRHGSPCEASYSHASLH